MLLAEDETAQPANLRMLENLPAETEGVALLLAGGLGREGSYENKTATEMRALYRSQSDDLVAEVCRIEVPQKDGGYLRFAASKSETSIVDYIFAKHCNAPHRV